MRSAGAACALPRPPALLACVPRARACAALAQRACRAPAAPALRAPGAERQHAGADSASMTTEVTAMVQNDQTVLSIKKQ